MRYLPLLSPLAFVLAACGSSSSSSSPSTPTPTRGPVYATVPKTSPVPVKTVKGQPTSAAKIKALPTPKPIHPVVATAIPASAYTATINGKVIDRKSGRAIVGALVQVSSSKKHETRTGGGGRFSISFPQGPAAPLAVSKKGYQQYLAIGIVRAKKHLLIIKLRLNGPGVPPGSPGFFTG